MRSIETKGKTVDEAIWSGLQELRLNRDQVIIEIIEAGSRGFLGLGSRLAHVRLTEIEEQEEKISFADLIKADLDLSLEPTKNLKKEPVKKEPIKTKEKSEKEININSPSAQSINSVQESKPTVVKVKPKEEFPQQPLILPGEKISPKLKREISVDKPRETREPREARERVRTSSVDTGKRPQVLKNRRTARTKSISKINHVIWPLPQDEAGLKAYYFAKGVIEAMELDCTVNVKTEGKEIFVDLGGDAGDLGVLIGKRGVTLDAFQYLLNVVANREQEDRNRVSLNVGDYRQRREETLVSLAQRLAEEVINTGRAKALEPMSARERRLIHMALQEYEGVYTESSGEDTMRHIVIYKK